MAAPEEPLGEPAQAHTQHAQAAAARIWTEQRAAGDREHQEGRSPSELLEEQTLKKQKAK